VTVPPRNGEGQVRDLGLAALLAALLGGAWWWRDRANLAASRLPDTDDLMRLQQVRDWLNGQPWADVAQHRLAGGLPMHWTRAGDLGPAGLIAGGMPEAAAVALWPLVLFAAALFLTVRVARAAGGAAAVLPAAVIAAMAYPASTVFAPGRIDHHGLQLVLLLAATLALVGRASVVRGALAGLAAAGSLVVGLELVPLVGVLGLVAAADWVAGRRGARALLAGFGGGALTGLLLGRVAFATGAFDYPRRWCWRSCPCCWPPGRSPRGDASGPRRRWRRVAWRWPSRCTARPAASSPMARSTRR
jgi:hypothetical protein